MVKIILRHGLAALASEIASGTQCGCCSFLVIVKRRVNNMDLSFLRQVNFCCCQYFTQGRKVLDRGSKEDHIKLFIDRHSVTDITQLEYKVCAPEHPPGLFQFNCINIQPNNGCIFYPCKQVGKPAVATAHFQDTE